MTDQVSPNCLFETTVLFDGWHYHVCRQCDCRRLGPPDKPSYVKQCDAWRKSSGATKGIRTKTVNDITSPCIRLGGEVRAMSVKLCNGKADLRAISACSLHGECVVMKPAVCGMALCEHCAEYTKEESLVASKAEK